jgi:molecular chaperone DnaK (HSP70)
MTKDNHLLGSLNLDGIPLAPSGTPQIVVTFDIDADGILKVQAEEKAFGIYEKITINNGLSKDDIDKMVREAEKYRDADEKFKKQAKAKNSLEIYCF